MTEIVAIVEGQTEQTFVRSQLAAHLGLRGITVWPVLPGKTRKSGGVKKWESSRNDIIRTLKERRYCTTMFDFYAMPADWPGREDAGRLSWEQRGSHVESNILDDLAQHMGESWDPSQLIPYVQMHEFEALVFSNTEKLADVCAALCDSPREDLRGKFDEILEEAGDPEAIDDGYETCPSRRITGLVPRYRKRLHSPIVATRVGFDQLRETCNHFASWIRKLEGLESAH